MNAEGYISRRQASKLLKVDGTNGSQIPMVPAKRLKMVYYRQSDFDALSGGPGLPTLAVEESAAAVPTREGGTPGSLESAPKDDSDEKYNNPRVLYAKQVAGILGISGGAFHTMMSNWRKAGKPILMKHGNARPYYKLGEVLKFKDEHFTGRKRRSVGMAKRVMDVLRLMPNHTRSEIEILPDDLVTSLQTTVNHLARNVLGIKCSTERQGNKLIITRDA